MKDIKPTDIHTTVPCSSKGTSQCKPRSQMWFSPRFRHGLRNVKFPGPLLKIWRIPRAFQRPRSRYRLLPLLAQGSRGGAGQHTAACSVRSQKLCKMFPLQYSARASSFFPKDERVLMMQRGQGAEGPTQKRRTDNSRARPGGVYRLAFPHSHEVQPDTVKPGTITIYLFYL